MPGRLLKSPPERSCRVSRVPLLRLLVQSLSEAGPPSVGNLLHTGTGVWRGIELIEYHRSLPCPEEKWRQGKVLTLSTNKASKIIGQRKNPSYPIPVPDWGWDLGKAGTCPWKLEWWQGRC